MNTIGQLATNRYEQLYKKAEDQRMKKKMMIQKQQNEIDPCCTFQPETALSKVKRFDILKNT